MTILAALALAAASAPPGPRCDVALDRVAPVLRRAFALHEQDDYPRARACFERALALAGAAGDAPSEAEARRGLGRTLLRQGHHDAAAVELDAALALFDAQDDALGTARTESHLGSVAMQQGRRDEARELYEDARDRFDAVEG